MNKQTLELILSDPYGYAKKVTVNKLTSALGELSVHYYNTGSPLVSDEVYDILRGVLERRDPTNDFLKQIGAPISKDKVKLPHRMPSLDKIKPKTDELSKWIKKYSGPYVLSDKLDGVSGLIYKDKSGKIKLFTRGDGEKGQDISHLIPYVVSKNTNFDIMKNGNAVRGELIISKENFKTVDKKFKNARNSVAGLVNSKSISKDVANITEFVAYAVIDPELKQYEQMKMLEKWGFQTVTYIKRTELSNDYLSKYLIKRRAESIYDIDGIVVMDSSNVYSQTDDNPEHGFAFKTVLTDQVAEVTVLDVEWDVSMHGYLKPRVKIEPITLVGVEINYATAFNAKFVKDNVLGPGAVIKLVRSGDVIPHILEVLKPSANGKPKMPSVPYKWNKTNIDIIVKDIHGASKDRILVKQISHFFKVMGVKYISEGLVTKLVDAGYKSIISILTADKNELFDIDGIGKTIVTKIFTNIKKAFEDTTLYRIMAATTLFGKGFGVRKSRLIVDYYPNIMTVKWDTKEMIEKITEIDGFDTLTATQFANNFDRFKEFYKSLEKAVNIKHITNMKKGLKKSSDQIFKNMTIVFTGVRDKELEKIVEERGGSVKTTVSSNSSVVVYSDKTTAKYKKAIELKIPTYTLIEFKQKYSLN